MNTSVKKKIVVGLGVAVIFVEQYFKMAGEQLRKLNKELELSVKQKNIKLTEYNKMLQQEISERKQAEEQLINSNAKLRHLSARLQFVREEERTRIAREIHDELGQQLTVLKMDVSWLHKRFNKEQNELADKTKVMLKLVDETMYSIRRISTDLRPGILDDLGLMAAIDWQCKEFEIRTNIKFRLDTALNEFNCSPDFSTAVFRIFQETITNALKHSGASLICISIKVIDNKLLLEIQDNGKGITEDEIKKNTSLGLLGMRERAHIFNGELSIWGISGKGTLVKLKIPLTEQISYS